MEYTEESSALHPKDPRIAFVGSVFIQHYDSELKKKKLYIHRKNGSITIDVRTRVMFPSEKGLRKTLEKL